MYSWIIKHLKEIINYYRSITATPLPLLGSGIFLKALMLKMLGLIWKHLKAMDQSRRSSYCWRYALYGNCRTLDLLFPSEQMSICSASQSSPTVMCCLDTDSKATWVIEQRLRAVKLSKSKPSSLCSFSYRKQISATTIVKFVNLEKSPTISSLLLFS